jgi:hypothetical protein
VPLTSNHSEEMFVLLEQAAIAAEKLMLSGTYTAAFQKFSQVDDLTLTQLANYPGIVSSCINQMSGVTVCVAPLTREYAIYIRPGAEEKVTDHMRIYINAHLLLRMDLVLNANANSFIRAKLVSEFTSLLAGKIFHEANHLLLTLVDDADMSMNLIGVTDKGEACTPPKKHFGFIFKDFGSLMERACFGGILLLECWEEMSLSPKVLIAKCESLKPRTAVPTISSIGMGVLDSVVPFEATEPTTSRKRPRSSSSRQSSSSKTQECESESDEAGDAEEGEGTKFVSVQLWSSKKRQSTVATARP